MHGADNLADGSMANCSGGTTPWGTSLSCEENYDGYGLTFKGSTVDFTYGWDSVDPSLPRTQQQDGSYVPSAAATQYDPTTGVARESRKYGWVCEHDSYDPKFVGRKHTALGRFRHENTAFRAARGKKFVLYMGDDQANQAIYKFISSRAFDRTASRDEHLKILTEGQLYVARFTPEGRRRFVSGQVVTPTSGGGRWVPVATSDLFDTRLRLAGFPTNEVAGSPPVAVARRARQQASANNLDGANEATFAGRYNRLVDPSKPESASDYMFVGDGTPPAAYVNEWDTHFATNRPEDVEVATDGTIFVALTNNSTVGDTQGSVRRMNEAGNDPEALTFTWDEFAAGGSKPGAPAGEQGFASPDNLVFDSQDNIWVVTDISSASLNSGSGSAAVYQYHKNNAVFMIPRGESGVAFRFANMPIQSEGTGPYFTPDESTLFLTVQHPGEEAKNSDTSKLGDPVTFSSYWPNGNKTTNTNPSEPRPSLIAIYRPRTGGGGPQPTPPVVPPGNVLPPPAPTADTRPPAVRITAPKKTTLRTLRTSGLSVTVEIDEAATVEVRLTGRVRYRSGRRQRTLGATTLGSVTTTRGKGKFTVRIRPSILARLTLSRPGADILAERIVVVARDRAGNSRTTSRPASVKR